MNYVELFAGCGGLSLGLESEHFELLLANELSPMAAETFAFNHLDLNLDLNGIRPHDKVLWLSSQHDRSNHKKRLSENPFLAAGMDNKVCDLDEVEDFSNELFGGLLVGSILDLNRALDSKKHKAFRDALVNGFGEGRIDLVSGGPPCQSFSMAGMRRHSDEKNSLPWAFAEFVKVAQPKIALLENVTGILRPFDVDGEKRYAWFEVAKAFATEGYVPLCLHVNAKFAGAAQNRPRFIMIALHNEEAVKLLKPETEKPFLEALENSYAFFDMVFNKSIEPAYGALAIHDLHKDDELFRTDSFEPLRRYKGREFTVRDAIDDLSGGKKVSQEYLSLINQSLGEKYSSFDGKPPNNSPPVNNRKVQSRFRLYQVLNHLQSDHRRTIKDFLRKADDSKLTRSEINVLAKGIDSEIVSEFKKKKNWLLNIEGNKFPVRNRSDLVKFLTFMHTKKQTQNALVADKPAPAALSIPDDACHYREGKRQRTLTVREMARFQSFPDGFKFCSKVTTGGQMRKFQVPQYTQVGNAVPPLLGQALGKVCRRLIELGESK